MTKFSSEIGNLADKTQLHDPINIANTNPKHLIRMLKMMLIIRKVEEVIADLIEAGLVKCPCHLGVGQEAAAVGVCEELRSTDRVFGTHRAHAHYLALGASVYQLFAEVLGKVTGTSKGMGGSMHLLAKSQGFYGSVPIVGATIPIAVGAALAAKMDKRGDAAVCFFGDGAAEEGVLHESLNLASVHQLPVLFVCENNFYSSHLDIKLRQPSDRVARFADAHCIPNKTVDGNDVIAVQQAMQELMTAVRAGKDAAFLEVVTYRWRGHVGPKEDIDVGVRRKKEDLIAWKKRDPIARLAEAMMQAGLIKLNEYQEMQQTVDASIAADKELALQDPYPDVDALQASVYATCE